MIVRRRLRYETWYFVHLYAYLGDRARVQPPARHRHATSSATRPPARTGWRSTSITLAIVVVFRLGVPLARSLRHRLHVARVVEEGPGVVSIEIGGVAARAAGRARRPVLHLALPDPRPLVGGAPVLALRRRPTAQRLRITVKGLGDYTARLRRDPARARA